MHDQSAEMPKNYFAFTSGGLVPLGCCYDLSEAEAKAPPQTCQIFTSEELQKLVAQALQQLSGCYHVRRTYNV